jgi:DNA polymerase III delta prime subunit
MNANLYQPQSVVEIVFGNDESKALVEEITSGLLPFPFEGKTGILLYGTFGTGKTTLARLLPAAIELGQAGCELNEEAEFFGCQQGTTSAAIAELVKKQLNVLSFNRGGRRYYIFDEVDNLSKGAQAGLKTTLNSPNGVFILTTNNISKLDKGVKDRCVLVEMNAPRDDEFLPLARRIAADNKVVISDAELLAKIAGNNGSFRSVIFAVTRLCRRRPLMTVQAASIAAQAISMAAGKPLPPLSAP